ncbi:protein of unknown function [Lentzea jiangxiensis]|uniref:DUF4333 domain-containing protein n=2 Tax=Lentzea jiangxiensis TaxID=641025 RepID=A0A1H0UL15_9PSEU|nr:protein of unknown function [Lentzea jiangxiensis]
MFGLSLLFGVGTTACSATVTGTAGFAPVTVTVVSTVTVPQPALEGRKVFVPAAVERGIVRILTEEYKISGVGPVTCPEGQEVAPDNSFFCTVRVDGKQKFVKVVVKSSEGEYEVGQPSER